MVPRKRVVLHGKSKMFDFFKNVFRNKADKPVGGQDRPHASLPPPPPPMPVQARSASVGSALTSTSRIRQNPIARTPAPAAPVAAPASYAPSNGYGNGAVDYTSNGHSNGNGNGNALYVPLQGILNALPPELKSKVRQPEVGEMTVQLPLEKVLGQLSRGQVRLTFGELRQAVPAVFSSDSGQDHAQISIPLNDVLSRMNPALLARRQQRRIEVPEEIRSPFGDQGQGLAFSPAPARAAAPTQPRATTSLPTTPIPQQRAYTPQYTPQVAPPTPPQHMPAPSASQPISFQAPIARQPAPAPMSPVNPIAPNPIAPSSIAPTPGAGPGYARPSAGPAPTIAPSAALRSLAGMAPAQPAPAAPAPAAAPAPKPIDESACLFVAIGALAESWPESVRMEIGQLNIANEKVALPLEIVEPGLKKGKIAVPWKTLRSWIRPAQPASVSAHDGVTLELPIKVMFPLFLSRQKAGAGGKQKVAIDETIPNLFFGFPGTEAAPAPAPSGLSHPVNKPIDTNYYTKSDVPTLSDTEMMAKGTPSTEFLKRCATPNEVVSRAAALDGVAGALIALPDGLMVANRLQADLNPDTLAAFLPQIFGKVSQCTKELRMGDLNNLNFTVGNVPWKIFRVNAIYFAAFGRPHEPLPTGQLAALAAELDRKNK